MGRILTTMRDMPARVDEGEENLLLFLCTLPLTDIIDEPVYQERNG